MALYHTAHFFIEGRDDDHRQIASGSRGLERLEYIEPVHFGHDDIEKDQVKWIVRNLFERQLAAFDRHGVMAKRLDRLFQLQTNRT